MKEQLIIDPTTVYEIDMECLQHKQEHRPAEPEEMVESFETEDAMKEPAP